MQLILGTTSQSIASTRERPVIQNLGPGNVYIDTDGDVDSSSGLKLVVGAVYEFPTSGSPSKIYLVADMPSTDVRIIGMG